MSGWPYLPPWNLTLTYRFPSRASGGDVPSVFQGVPSWFSRGWGRPLVFPGGDVPHKPPVIHTYILKLFSFITRNIGSGLSCYGMMIDHNIFMTHRYYSVELKLWNICMIVRVINNFMKMNEWWRRGRWRRGNVRNAAWFPETLTESHHPSSSFLSLKLSQLVPDNNLKKHIFRSSYKRRLFLYFNFFLSWELILFGKNSRKSTLFGHWDLILLLVSCSGSSGKEENGVSTTARFFNRRKIGRPLPKKGKNGFKRRMKFGR